MFDLAQILRKGQVKGLLATLMQRTKFLAWAILHSGDVLVHLNLVLSGTSNV